VELGLVGETLLYDMEAGRRPQPLLQPVWTDCLGWRWHSCGRCKSDGILR